MAGESVVVVGAGPAGALLGIELARQGADVRIIEKLPAPPAESRAGGVQSRTLELFARLGLANELLGVGNRMRAFNYYSGTKRILRVDFGQLPGPFPFMLQVPQYETQRVLDAELERLGVPVERGTALVDLRQDGEGATLTTQAAGCTSEVAADFVVGCDGAHSTVRHAIGIPFEGEAYSWDWLGADLEVDWAYPDNEAHIFLSPSGVLACLPFVGRWRILTARPGSVGVEHPVPPSLEEVRALMAERGPSAMSVDNPSWLGVFRASRRSAPRFRVGRVFLAGDAVHIHNPAAGQGMNTGLGDAANLGWKLGLVATGRAPATLLDTYETERAPAARDVIALTHRLVKVLDPHWRWSRLRDALGPALSAAAPFQQRLSARMGQHGISYRGGPLAPSPQGSLPRPGAVRAGDRAPEVGGLFLDGRRTSLFSLIARPQHTLLVADGPTRSRLEGTMAAFEGDVALFPVGRQPGDGLVVDRLGRLNRCYGIRPGRVCLIRPDGYVGYVGGEEGLERYLGRCLLPQVVLTGGR